MDLKAECGWFNLAQVTRNKKSKKLKQTWVWFTKCLIAGYIQGLQ